MKKIFIYLIKIHFRLFFSRYIIWGVLLSFFIFFLSIFYINIVPLMTSPIGWERTFSLSALKLKSKNIGVSAKSNYIAVAYEAVENNKNSVFVSLSLDRGNSFLAPIKLYTGALSDNTSANMSPHVAVSSDGKVFVTWQDYDPFESTYRIFYTLSSDLGANWSQYKKINLNTEMELLPRAYYDDKNVLHLFYHGLKDEKFVLYHSIDSNRDMFFQNTKALMELKEEMRGAFFPAISMQGEYMFMVWQSKELSRGALADDLFFMRSSNYGDSWSSPERITTSYANDVAPQIIIHNNTIYCVYQNNENKNWQIKLVKGLYYGESWSNTATLISDTNANCYFPSALLSETNEDLLIFWYDNRDGNNRVYMRKYNLGNLSLSKTQPVSEKGKSASKPIAIRAGNRVLCLWKQNERLRGKYSDISVKIPRVYSDTHQEDAWSRSTTAILRWNSPKDESGIVGYATIVNKFPYFNPTVQNLQGNVDQISIPFLEDGISYFHIRAIDGAGNYSRTYHYKLQVSRNPLPFPIVSSPTHKEAKSSDSNAPKLAWEQSEIERVKGFRYSLSKNYPLRPDKYIRKKSIAFKDLSQGRYYFSIQAIDKTNSPGRIISYEIIVGQADKIDPSLYSKFAQKLKYKGSEVKEVKRKFGKPRLLVKLPVKKEEIWQKGELVANLKVKTYSKSVKFKPLGYSVVIQKEKKYPAKKITNKKKQIKFENLESGIYYLSARMKYTYTYNNKKITEWSRPVVKKINIQIPHISPFAYWEKEIMDRYYSNWEYITLGALFMSFLIIYIGLGSKLIFYIRAFKYKIITRIRILISS